MEEFHREHSLINNRMGWYTTSQSFLAIAVASAGQAEHNLTWLVWVIPVVGMAVTVVTYASILAALSVQDTLKEKRLTLTTRFFDQHSYTDEQKTIILEPWGIRDGRVQSRGMWAPRSIPILMFIFWSAILILHQVL